jgi:photosystem II stability/assembly factor-like uncharacterized protein
MKKYFLVVLNIITLILVVIGNIKAQHIETLHQDKTVSIRGLSVVNDKVAWASSSKGYTALTIDGGKTWTWQQVKGFERSDFRSVEAFSDKEAIIMSSGTPALILKTIDGGANWLVKYRNTDTTYFLDAMAFENNQHGYVLGDPINGKFVLLETKDGGETWKMFNNRPNALPSEAAFAASGTCLRVEGKKINIVTGGSVARRLTSNQSDTGWLISNLPLAQGLPSKGAFSIAGNGWVVVGGNYSKDKNTDSTACVNNGVMTNFTLSKQGPYGYQSCVEAINSKTYLSTGTSGSNISMDGGQTWIKFDGTSYNVCRKAKQGKLILLAGDGGKIGILKM